MEVPEGALALEDMVAFGDDDEVAQNPSSPFVAEAMEEVEQKGISRDIDERGEIWQQENLLDDVNDSSSIFYGDFPPLPDFPCMSSTSSSSSTPAPTKAMASSSASSSSSSAASWVGLKSEAPPAALSSTASMEALLPPSTDGVIGDVDCMDVMENFGYMDLIDSNDIWDPSSIFQTDNESSQVNPQDSQKPYVQEGGSVQDQPHQAVQEKRPVLDDLGVMFFEWLKSNKDHISAEDMRNIKLKRSTVESASKRLGSTKEGKKQLLKLILEWVAQYQLSKKRAGEASAAAAASCQYQDPFQNPNLSMPNPSPNSNFDCNTMLPPSDLMWDTVAPPPSYVMDQTVMAGAQVFPQMMGYMGTTDAYNNANVANSVHPYPPPPSTDYHMLESVQSWPPSQFSAVHPSHYNAYPDNSCQNLSMASAAPQSVGVSGGDQQYHYPAVYNAGNGEVQVLRLGSSATKEARKKRMARQRRFSSYHHRRHHQHQQSQHQNQIQNATDQHARNVGSDNCTNNAAQGNPGNWMYCNWPAAPTVSSVPMMMPAMETPPQPQRADRSSMQTQNYQRPASDKRQGWKPEKNLKFLLQKVLKQSDVGNLGRIVLPKKEAESHLPELEARDGIPIAMEDIGTSRVWNLRYRFWPNNKSRMYLLENTGDFVRTNGLQEGDFIVIYSDVKCGKYLIRGVKVRQPGSKSEGKKPAKKNLRNAAAAAATARSGNASSSSPTKQVAK
ncbi:hypothetical protein RJ639_034987 [Escallonia herrerae]|uniref:TF-B3 domain-containing protein n=1 Tax=Escallonia herrerae TaxID=1293975 RepID=A0AA89BCP2_9ASTE|nr:hypothetical protein RJ639_034987 [Escallonia herrerae]